MYRFEAIVQNMSFALLDHHHKKVPECLSNYNCITDLQAKYMHTHIQVYPRHFEESSNRKTSVAFQQQV